MRAAFVSVVVLLSGLVFEARAQTGFSHPVELASRLGAALDDKPEDYEPRTRHLDAEGRPRFVNRLILEPSPYLRQHAHNPVNWYPWGAEALARAASEDRPIFLSIGYSTCHWCHVMEEESFDDLEIAAILNEHFVAIKVDREQRPDLDEIYMTAVQVMGNRGGWPMSSFLTPEGHPFFGATYFPPDRFEQVLRSVDRAWREDRSKLLDVAGNVVDRVRQLSAARGEAVQIGQQAVAAARDQILSMEDRQLGGFGRAPKFPHETELLFAADLAHRTGDPELTSLLERALEAMARGGIFDQVGGGFHRYATDGAWRVPHFEKMLYNQALLARAYIAGYRLTGRRFFRRVARQTLDYVLAEMRAAQGGFYSATDADSEGEEGVFFVWTPEQIDAVLGPEEGSFVAGAFGVTPEGNFEGRTVLHLPQRLGELAVSEGAQLDSQLERLDLARRQLWRARADREPPLRDDKILTAWNAMMVTALAEAAPLLGDRYLDAAEAAADFLWRHSRSPNGGLMRIHLDGAASTPAHQKDYAAFAESLLALYDARTEPVHLERALELLDRMDELFRDPEVGGYFVAAAQSEAPLFARSRSPRDGAVPSGNSTALRALAMAARRGGRLVDQSRAEALVQSFSSSIARSPRSHAYLLLGWGGLEPVQTAPVAYGARGVVRVRPEVSAGPDLGLTLRLEIAEGWHVNAHQPLDATLVGTSLAVTP
ncbi:MAG: thioredoxin domain-containing protein, partial [Acidobacteriota bacterium]|nr:thioredoxin domain-containing protein [Acidobacteriota bacterium]